MANPKDKTNKKSSNNSGIKPVTGKIQPFTGKIEPLNYKPSGSKSSSQKPSSNKNASSSKTKQAPKKEKGFVDKANDFIDWAFRAAANKPKVSAPKPEKKPVEKLEPIKMEIKRPGKIESTGPKELQGVTPPKSAVDVDKSIDAAMDAIGKSKIMRKGGSVKSKTINKMKTMKRYQGGGSIAADKAMATPAKSTTVKEEAAIPSAKKMKTGGMVNKKKKYGEGGPTTKPESAPMEQKSQPNTPPTGSNKLYGRGIAKKMKTGGMVNPNAKLQASKKAGSKGVMHSLSAKAIVQKIAKGRSGGTSKAPKTATPKAKYGMIMRKK